MKNLQPVHKKEERHIRHKQYHGNPANLFQQENDLIFNKTILLLVILLVTFFAFLPSLANHFITTWDDNIYVTDNPLIKHLNWESIKGCFTTSKNGTYVPIPLLSWALEYKLFGLNPLAYHLDNLLLHLFCTTLVFYFFHLLRLPVIYAATGALLWGIHPMHVESVAWVAERKDLLFALFYLGEYGHMLAGSALLTTFFLGGWHGPAIPLLPAVISSIIWFVAKVYFFMFCFIWIRATYPRYRYDQLMRLGWKVFLPLAILNIVITGIVVSIHL